MPQTESQTQPSQPGVQSWRKICVIGSPGAGKSTFSRQLGEILGLPVVHLDSLFWEPGWKQVERQVFLQRLDEAVGHPAWIIDGHYGATLGHRLALADCVVFLDFPKLLCLTRVVRRAFRHEIRTDLPEGCPEKFDPVFLKYVWRFRVDSRPRAVRIIDELPPGIDIVRLINPRQAMSWLNRLRSAL